MFKNDRDYSVSVMGCCLGLVVSFFVLAWVDLGLVTFRGYELAREVAVYLFLIPLASGATVLRGLIAGKNRIGGLITGVVTMATMLWAVFFAVRAGEESRRSLRETAGPGNIGDVPGYDAASDLFSAILGLGPGVTALLGVAVFFFALFDPSRPRYRSTSAPRNSQNPIAMEVVMWAGFCLLGAFFMAWFHVESPPTSGLEAAWSEVPYLFVVPGLAALTIVMSYTSYGNYLVARITSLVTLVAVFLSILHFQKIDPDPTAAPSEQALLARGIAVSLAAAVVMTGATFFRDSG